MKILVTGAAGFIGFHLSKSLLERGDEVVGLDNINDYYDVRLKLDRLAELGIVSPEEGETLQSSSYRKFKFLKGDITDQKRINELFETEQFDAVCNLAAQAGVRYSLEDPHSYVNSNIVGFLNILEACRNYGVENLSYASSSSVYGLNSSQPFKTSDHTDHPASLYAASKKSNEMMAHAYSHLFGIRTTGLRFFTVYGPWGRPDMAPMLFAEAIMNQTQINVFNHGNMSRDFTYIDDIVDGVIRVIDNPAKPRGTTEAFSAANSTAPYRVFNIGNNSPVGLMDFISLLEENFGQVAEKNFLGMQPGDVESTFADSSELMGHGYRPSTDIVTGVSEFAAWYKQWVDKRDK